jgi:hypothetical protein
LYTKHGRSGSKEVGCTETTRRQGNETKIYRKIEEEMEENRKERNIEENWKRTEK